MIVARTDHGLSRFFVNFQRDFSVANEEGEVKQVFDALTKASGVDDALEQIHPSAVAEQILELEKR